MSQRLGKLTIPLFLSIFVLVALVIAINSPAGASEGDAPSGHVTVMGQWAGDDAVNFNLVLDEYFNRTGHTFTYIEEGDLYTFLLNCVANMNCPDVAMVPWPGLIAELVGQGDLILMDPVVPDFDMYYSAAWRDFASTEGVLYSIPFRAGHKSLIWYQPDKFIDIGVTPPVLPANWEELLGLSDALLAGGHTPFSIGAFSNGPDGWPLSDFFENTLLRASGVEIHQRLTGHEILWTDPRVIEGALYYLSVLGNDAYLVGGRAGVISTHWIDAFERVFNPPFEGAMDPNGNFMEGFLPPGAIPIDDYDTFMYPEINPVHGSPIVTAADFAVGFNNRPETELLLQFLAHPDAAEIWAPLGGFLSPNGGVDLAAYPNDVNRGWANELVTASGVVFDLDDQLPGELQEFVWASMIDMVANPDELMLILANIEREATRLQGPAPYQQNYLPLSLK